MAVHCDSSVAGSNRSNTRAGCGICGRLHFRFLERLGTHYARPRNRKPYSDGISEITWNISGQENCPRINHSAFRHSDFRRRIYDVLHDILAARTSR